MLSKREALIAVTFYGCGMVVVLFMLFMLTGCGTPDRHNPILWDPMNPFDTNHR